MSSVDAAISETGQYIAHDDPLIIGGSARIEEIPQESPASSSSQLVRSQ